MSDAPSSSDGPKRTSTEPTLAIPRDQLPPPSLRDLAALDLDPDHPETQELLQRAYGSGDRETMDPCPVCSDCRCCRSCRFCGNLGMVSPMRAAAFDDLVRFMNATTIPANDEDPSPEAA